MLYISCGTLVGNRISQFVGCSEDNSTVRLFLVWVFSVEDYTLGNT